MRGLAILAVMLFHFTDVESHPGGWASFLFFWTHLGRHGVDLFFVLSGFLVGGLLLKEWKDTGGVDAKRFLLRRIFKLWPPLYALVLFHVILGRHPLTSFFWQTLFHVQNFYGTSLLQTWSLAIEEHFYLLLVVGIALLVWFGARNGTNEGRTGAAILAFCAAGCSLSLLIRCAVVHFYPNTINIYWTQYRLDAPFLGVALAALFHLRPEIYRGIATRRWPLVLICLGGLALLVWKPYESDTMSTVGMTIVALTCCAFLVLMLEHSGRARHWLVYKIVARIGVYAYGIFLWHTVLREPTARLFHRLPESWGWMISLPCELAAACALGFIATHMVEWPFLRWRESRPYLADHSRLLPVTELGDELTGAEERPDNLEPLAVAVGAD